MPSAKYVLTLFGFPGDVLHHNVIPATIKSIPLLIFALALLSCQPATEQATHEASDYDAMTEQPAGVLSLGNVEWTENLPGLSFGTAETAHGRFARFEPGLMTPWHTHSGAYHGVVIAGTLTNPFQGEEDPPEMGPGDYWFVPGGANHTTNCVSDEPA